MLSALKLGHPDILLIKLSYFDIVELPQCYPSSAVMNVEIKVILTCLHQLPEFGIPVTHPL